MRGRLTCGNRVDLGADRDVVKANASEPAANHAARKPKHLHRAIGEGESVFDTPRRSRVYIIYIYIYIYIYILIYTHLLFVAHGNKNVRKQQWALNGYELLMHAYGKETPITTG